MKKVFFVTIGVLVFVFITAGLVSADGGPHGGYTATTDACAGCHRAHTASGPNLLIEATTYDLCISCHGSVGTGADSNVLDGVWLEGRNPTDTTGDANTTDNANLLGGGFVNYGGSAVTSIHDADDSTAAAWGNGVNRGVAAALTDGNLTCASCHDPHGSNNYRIIKETINGNPVNVAQVDEGAAKDYDTEQWNTGTSAFCSACHDAYHRTNAGQGSTLDAGTYTHRIDMSYSYGGNANPETVGMGGYTLPLAETDMVVCMTCHLPHGTSATMTGWAAGTYDPFGANPPGPIPSGDSALLRLGNRGVCEVCHQK
ncbi:MAG: hypothetical protein KKA73_25860 [Chloroflexi bacterium]|nr:hypothetical protein [Chloroflexota bacterium]MBU1751125.1 hypothetical protein [Chloroflexota bacterium]MBU1878784.1 hypothetical protein [Chloroflexota bacterium]